MKNRIKRIVEHENLTYSKFADILGIQRSAVSHILSGRNNPSLEVVQKILESFNYINTDWLLFGTGKMKKDLTQGNLFSAVDESSDMKENKTKKEDADGIQSISKEYAVEITKENESIKAQTRVENRTDIDKIVIFYSDKTMEVFFHKEND